MIYCVKGIDEASNHILSTDYSVSLGKSPYSKLTGPQAKITKYQH